MTLIPEARRPPSLPVVLYRSTVRLIESNSKSRKYHSNSPISPYPTPQPESEELITALRYDAESTTQME